MDRHSSEIQGRPLEKRPTCAVRSALVVCTTSIAYLALNFTGATSLISQTGVAREMRRYIRPMVALAALAILLTISIAIWRYMEG